MTQIQINNPKVAQYYEHLDNIVNDQSIPREERIKAAHKQYIVTLLAALYEQNEPVTLEDLTWAEAGDPVLPEDAGLILDEMEKKRNRFSVIKGGKQ